VPLNIPKALLTYRAPFLVATYGAVAAIQVNADSGNGHDPAPSHRVSELSHPNLHDC
jgi:hypothetical protein